MKKVTIILLSLIFTITLCYSLTNKNKLEKNSSLKLVNGGKQVKDFVPENWVIIEQVTGDLNKDKLDDIALVIQATDPKNILANDGLGADTIDTNPRSLIVLFKDTNGNGYNLAVKNDSFILSHEDPVMANPFSNITIKNGTLKLHFSSWASAGTWYMSNNTYVFRYQDNDFTLIGADYQETHRASGETTEFSINFLTKNIV